jgi:hypothetical protein
MTKTKKTPNLPDLKTLYEAGIDPKSKLPSRVVDDIDLKPNLKKFLRIIDEQDAVNRYVWYNLPCNISSQELERLIYYKGQLCFFYLEDTNEFYFMPYALDGTIDFYGRFNRIHPVPMTAGTTEEEKRQVESQASLLSTIKLKVQKGIILPEELKAEDLFESAVILRDYTNQLPQLIVPRVSLNDPLLDVMSEIIPFMRTSLIAGTGIKGVRVNDADSSDQVKMASRSVVKSALRGELWSAIESSIDFQDLTNGQLTRAEDYLLSLQALDNLRLSAYGLENGGLFEKKAHILESENDINNVNVGLVMQDGLSIRQNFCNIVNSIWDLGIWCEPAESMLGVDNDGDGRAYDEDTGEHSGVETNTIQGDNDYE